jgi:hypothetical protein
MLVALCLLAGTLGPVVHAVMIVLVVWCGCVCPFYHEVFHFSFLFLGALSSMLRSLMDPDADEDLLLVCYICLLL